MVAFLSFCSRSFPVIHPFHPFIALQVYCKCSFQKKKRYHFFTDNPSMTLITCCINFAFLSISYRALYDLVPPHHPGVVTATPPFTLGHTMPRFSDPALLKCLWFFKLLCFISASVLQDQCGAIVYFSSSAENALHPNGSLRCLENSRSSWNTPCKHCIVWNGYSLLP